MPYRKSGGFSNDDLLGILQGVAGSAVGILPGQGSNVKDAGTGLWGNILADVMGLKEQSGSPFKPGADLTNFLGFDEPEQQMPPFALKGALYGGALNSKPTQQEGDPLQDMISELYGLITSGGGGPGEQDLQAALNDAAAGINKQYGAQIGGIRDENAGARQDTKVGSREVQKMYKALARSYNKAGQREAKQGKGLAKTIAKMGKGSAENVTNQAAKLNESSVAAAEALGLADLGEELTGQTNETAQRLTGSANARNDLATKTVLGQAGNERTYMNSQGQGSRLEGTNRAADMYAQLQDYLQENRRKIQEIQGQRGAALAGSNASIASAFGEAQTDSRQAMIDNLLRLAGFAMDVEGSRASQLEAEQGEQPDFLGMLPDQMAGPMALLNQFGDPTTNELFSQLSGSSEMGNGFFEQGGSAYNRQPLQGNVSNINSWLQQELGQQYTNLSTSQRNILIATLLQQLEGQTINRSSYE